MPCVRRSADNKIRPASEGETNTPDKPLPSKSRPPIPTDHADNPPRAKTLQVVVTCVKYIPTCANLEVTFISNNLGEDGQKLVHDGAHVAEIRPIGIHVFDEETRAFLKQEFERFPVLSILVLWTRYGAGKLGILQLRPIRADEDTPVTGGYEEWEGRAIAAYLHRHSL